jgi:hypothetical protein
MTRLYGVTMAVVAYIETLHAHATFDTDKALAFVQRRIPTADYKKVSASIGRLTIKGLILPTSVKGVYQKPNGAPPAPVEPKRVDIERAVLDDLLDAMAKAEPVLQRCKKLLAALDELN